MITNNSQISFQAKFINTAQVLKRTDKKDFIPLKAAFAEIEPSNKNDIIALAKLDKYWADSFACNIFSRAKKLKSGAGNSKIYALTRQINCFETLDENKILGLAEITPLTQKDIFINYLQVNPENVYAIQPQFKKVGTRILDSLKEMADKIILKPNSKGTDIFYQKNDFTPVSENSDVLQWVKRPL